MLLSIDIHLMPNSNSYVAFDLTADIQEQFYDISNQFASKIENFKPFEKEQIHMTVCFLGELSKKIPKDKKQTIEKLNVDIKNFEPINSLKFVGYELFGPKNNLIVARFSMCKTEEAKIIKFKSDCTEKYGAPNENFYVPHITLGKIQFANETNTVNISKLNVPNPEITNISSVKFKLV